MLLSRKNPKASTSTEAKQQPIIEKEKVTVFKKRKLTAKLAENYSKKKKVDIEKYKNILPKDDKRRLQIESREKEIEQMQEEDSEQVEDKEGEEDLSDWSDSDVSDKQAPNRVGKTTNDEDEDDDLDAFEEQLATVRLPYVKTTIVNENEEQEDETIEEEEDDSATVEISNLPDSFLQYFSIKEFLEQIAPLKQIVIDRKKRTAFVEFQFRETAEVVCENFDHYIIDKKDVRFQICTLSKSRQLKEIWEPLLLNSRIERARDYQIAEIADSVHIITVPGPQSISLQNQYDRELKVMKMYRLYSLPVNKERKMELIAMDMSKHREEKQKWQELGIQYEYDGTEE